MPKAIFNIGYTLPTPPANLKGNARAEYQARRNFYNLTADYNYFSYALNGEKVVKNANAEHYFTRENTNSGLFDFEGAMTDEQKVDLKEMLKDTKSIIWHGFISFDEETSRGFNTQENACKFMRQTFGGFLERAGFKKENIASYFALHNDTDHRHIHFAFVEKEPKRRDKYGVLGYRRLGKIDAKAIDNYLVSANMYLSEHHDEYYTARDESIAALKTVKENTVRQYNDATQKQNINLALNNLIAKLPETGRLGYHSKNMEKLRPEIDKVTTLLIASDIRAQKAHNQVLLQLKRVQNETEQLVKDNQLLYVNNRRLSKEEIEQLQSGKSSFAKGVNLENIDYFKQLEESYRGKLGNITIGLCKDLKQKNKYEARRAKVNDKSLKIAAKNRRKHRDSEISGILRAFIATSNKYIRTNFIKTVRENEYEIEREQRYGRGY